MQQEQALELGKGALIQSIVIVSFYEKRMGEKEKGDRQRILLVQGQKNRTLVLKYHSTLC